MATETRVDLILAFKNAASETFSQISGELTGLQEQANGVFTGVAPAAVAAGADAAGALADGLDSPEIGLAARTAGETAAEQFGDAAADAIPGLGVGLGDAFSKMLSVAKVPLIIGGAAILENVFEISPTTANQIVSMGFGVSELLGPVLSQAFVGPLNEIGAKIAGSAVGQQIIVVLTPVFAAVGSAVGGVMTVAIAAAPLLLPALLVAALVAALVFVVQNPEIIGQAAELGLNIVNGIVGAVFALPGLLLDIFVNISTLLLDTVGKMITGIVDFFLGIPGALLDLGSSIVGAIVDGMVSLPGRVADIITGAFRDLRIDVGPFHISGATGITIDTPTFLTPSGGAQSFMDEFQAKTGRAPTPLEFSQFQAGKLPGFAEGGIVPGRIGDPLLAVVHGGERVTPAGSVAGATVNINIASMSGINDPREFLQALKREVDRQGLSLVAG